MNSRYYNPEWGRSINADAITGQTGELLTHNMFAYCMNNPINMDDENGYMPRWVKVAIGATVIVGLAIATVTTGGAVAAIASAALGGALAGGGTGAVLGGIFGGITGGWDGALDGAADGFMYGAITGAITSGVAEGVQVARAKSVVNQVRINKGSPPKGYKGGRKFANDGRNDG